MTQHVYKKKFLPVGVSIFISAVFADDHIVSFDRYFFTGLFFCPHGAFTPFGQIENISKSEERGKIT